MGISTIIDIAFIVILLGVAALGLYKGFLKTALSMVGTVASALIGFLAAKPLGNLINSVFGSTSFFATKITNWLNSISTFFSTTRTGESFSSLVSEMTTGGVDGALQRLAKVVIGSGIIPEGQTVGQVIGNSLGAVVTSVIGGVVAFVLLRVIVKILEKIANKIIQVQIFGVIDKLLGFIFGLAKAFVYIAVAFGVMSILTYVKPIDNKLTPIMDQTVVAQKYYDWIDYEVQNFLNDTFFKKNGATDSENSTTTEQSATKIELIEVGNILSEINRAYIDAENKTVYLLTSADEITDVSTLLTTAKYYIEYLDDNGLAEIILTIDTYIDGQDGHAITIDNRPVVPDEPVEPAEQLFVDDLTLHILQTITNAYIDWTTNTAYFNTENKEIDLVDPLVNNDYYIDFTQDAEIGDQIITLIGEYNTNNGDTIILTESEIV